MVEGRGSDGANRNDNGTSKNGTDVAASDNPSLDSSKCSVDALVGLRSERFGEEKRKCSSSPSPPRASVEMVEVAASRKHENKPKSDDGNVSPNVEQRSPSRFEPLSASAAALVAEGRCLRISGLRKRFPLPGGEEKIAVKGLSTDLVEGEIFCLLGMSLSLLTAYAGYQFRYPSHHFSRDQSFRSCASAFLFLPRP